MKAKIHTLVERMTEALGPVFHAHPDYNDILQATCLVMARVLQSTPDRGSELTLCEEAFRITNTALIKFLDAEEAIQERKAKIMAKGIDGFNKLVEPGSAADHPDNSDQPVAKTPKHFEPSQGLAALNGGMGAEARDEAEKAQERASREETEQARDDTYRDS